MQITVKEDILFRNDDLALKLREKMKEKRIFVLNLLGSPGAGKTTLLEKTLSRLIDVKVAVIEGDLFTRADAERIERLNVPVIQINTSGGCHLNAQMVYEALDELNIDEIELLIIENVGNLVCPAEFDLGEDAKAVVLSITEGDDKPLKYPLIFKESAIVIFNKIDILEYTNFSLERAYDDVKKLNPEGKIVSVSAIKDDGMDEWIEWLRLQVNVKRSIL